MAEQIVKDGKMVVLNGETALSCDCCACIDCSAEYTCTTSNVFQGQYQPDSGPDFVALVFLDTTDCGSGFCTWLDAETVYLVPWVQDFRGGALYRLNLANLREIVIEWAVGAVGQKQFAVSARDGLPGRHVCFNTLILDDGPASLLFPGVVQTAEVSNDFNENDCGDVIFLPNRQQQAYGGVACWHWCNCGTLD